MHEQISPSSNERTVRANIGRVESVDLYEIKDSELELLEKGSLVSLDFTFAVFLFSMAFTSIAALATSDFKTSQLESIFLFVSIIGIGGGIYLMIRWWLSRKPLREVVLTIKDRIKPTAIQPPEGTEFRSRAVDDLLRALVETEMQAYEAHRRAANTRPENDESS